MQAVMQVGLPHYLIVAAALFAIGVYTVSTRTSAVAILMGVELILNSASLNFVAFAHHGGGIDGMVFSIFIIVLAAAEAAIALAIVLAIFRHFRTINAEETSTLRE
jgi:NADH-quinone oxidoreductase subunit K